MEGVHDRLRGRRIRGQGIRRREGEREDHENTLPLVGRVSGHVRLYEERGGGGQTRDGHRRNRRDAPVVCNHGRLEPCPRPWRGIGAAHRITAECLFRAK